MSDSLRYPTTRGGLQPARGADSLADVLERVLDKGIVIAGDIRVDLLDIELLTIRIRLLISSADKAAELGMAWWQQDPFYTGQTLENDRDGDGPSNTLEQLVDVAEELQRRVADLEGGDREASPGSPPPGGGDTDGGGD
ncbi:MAG TPA: gas vesicle protein [Nitriliruptorales bacterium]|nr:gas vesicle protein [Nitriliruptorales bacterium]